MGRAIGHIEQAELPFAGVGFEDLDLQSVLNIWDVTEVPDPESQRVAINLIERVVTRMSPPALLPHEKKVRLYAPKEFTQAVHDNVAAHAGPDEEPEVVNQRARRGAASALRSKTRREKSVENRARREAIHFIELSDFVRGYTALSKADASRQLNARYNEIKLLVDAIGDGNPWPKEKRSQMQNFLDYSLTQSQYKQEMWLWWLKVGEIGAERRADYFRDGQRAIDKMLRAGQLGRLAVVNPF